MIKSSIEKLKYFRKVIHEIFPAYSDATMDLIDALSTNQNAKSVTELSENRFFRRKYNSITKVIRHFLVPYKESDTENEQQNMSGFYTGEENTLKTASVNLAKDFRPNKELQKMIQRQIFNSCCELPEERNFFYLPVMSHQPLDLMRKP